MDAFTIICIVIGVLLVVGIVILTYVKPSQNIEKEIEAENKMYEEETHQKNADQIKDNVKKASLGFAIGVAKVLFTVVYFYVFGVAYLILDHIFLSGLERTSMTYSICNIILLILSLFFGYKLYKYFKKKIFKNKENTK